MQVVTGQLVFVLDTLEFLRKISILIDVFRLISDGYSQTIPRFKKIEYHLSTNSKSWSDNYRPGYVIKTIVTME